MMVDDANVQTIQPAMPAQDILHDVRVE